MAEKKEVLKAVYQVVLPDAVIYAAEPDSDSYRTPYQLIKPSIIEGSDKTDGSASK
jgi:hypothetical protein